MVFWDGVGLGREDPLLNPFFAAKLPHFRKLLDGSLPSLKRRRIFSPRSSATPVNTTLGIEGLPQSGTGQAAIFTGVNAPKKIGKHFGPHPYSTLVPVVKEKNIFVQLGAKGKTFNFANGYPQRYFDYINSPRGKTPTIALAYLAAGGKLNTIADIEGGLALSADFTNEGLKSFSDRLQVITPQEAGRRFYSIGWEFDYTLFEYFISDKAGHSQSMQKAVEALERMDGFLGGILELFDDKKDVLLFVSDHGNIEDLSTRSHTRYPVPLIVVGDRRKFFSDRISKLTDITPTIVDFITE